MIRLTRPACPAELTPQLRIDATTEYKATKKAVWDRPFIRSAVRAISNGKCAFCECNLEEESKYLEVEHFAHRNTYPDRVMDWLNFLPACRRCNAHKSTHDVIVDPIVNPADEDPRDHLNFELYRFDGRDAKGRMTVDVLNLNDYSRLMLSRFEIGSAVLQQLDEIAELLRKFDSSDTNVRPRNRILRQIRNLLIEAQPNSEYSATVATAIVHANDYEFVKLELQRHGMWNTDLAKLDMAMSGIAYPS